MAEHSQIPGSAAEHSSAAPCRSSSLTSLLTEPAARPSEFSRDPASGARPGAVEALGPVPFPVEGRRCKCCGVVYGEVEWQRLPLPWNGREFYTNDLHREQYRNCTTPKPDGKACDGTMSIIVECFRFDLEAA